MSVAARCGHGRQKHNLVAQIERLGLGDVVRLDPPTADIGADMAAASIFALSSRFEGFPLILLEAMSKHMAVVAFDCPTGPADIIEDRRNGILVGHDDVEGFTAGLLAMIEDEELRRTCAAGADRDRAPALDGGHRAAVGAAVRRAVGNYATGGDADGGVTAEVAVGSR